MNDNIIESQELIENKPPSLLSPSIMPSINQSINQSINHSIIQSMNQSITKYMYSWLHVVYVTN